MADANATAIPPRVKDLTGHPPFGRLTVVRYAGKNQQRYALWLCQCECGNSCTIRSSSLINGSTQSCGCLQKDTVTARNTTHGLTGSPEYGHWSGMLSRCADPYNEHYGAKGIRVCDRWQESFAAFLEDMGPRPSAKHSIERDDGDGGYCKENCRWATSKEQNRNSRRNRLLTHDGKTMCVAAWSEVTGIPSSILFSRLYHRWSAERALTTPVASTAQRRPA